MVDHHGGPISAQQPFISVFHLDHTNLRNPNSSVQYDRRVAAVEAGVTYQLEEHDQWSLHEPSNCGSLNAARRSWISTQMQTKSNDTTMISEKLS